MIKKTTLLGAIALFSFCSFSQFTFELVKDINPTGDSYSSSFTELNGKLYFQAYDGTNGIELWVTDGTTAGTQMIKDINPTGNSNPNSLTELNGKLYFGASDGTNGVELWVTDGTSAGTQMIKDINPTGSSNPYSLTELNGKLYFQAYDGTNGYELWVTDGTTTGTQMIKDINPTGSSFPYAFTEYNGKLYFQASDGTNGSELWVTDGTTAGTQMIKDINPTGSSYPQGFTEYNGKLYFVANDGTNGRELWVTDGTEVGTHKIAPDISPNSDPFASFSGFIVFDNALYFNANYTSVGDELYKLTTPDFSSIEKHAKNVNFKVYPNPTTGVLTIDTDIKGQFSIFDVTGKEVKSFEINNTQNKVHLSELNSGIYFIKESSTGSQIKIIKQ